LHRRVQPLLARRAQPCRRPEAAQPYQRPEVAEVCPRPEVAEACPRPVAQAVHRTALRAQPATALAGRLVHPARQAGADRPASAPARRPLAALPARSLLEPWLMAASLARSMVQEPLTAQAVSMRPVVAQPSAAASPEVAARLRAEAARPSAAASMAAEVAQTSAVVAQERPAVAAAARISAAAVVQPRAVAAAQPDAAAVAAQPQAEAAVSAAEVALLQAEVVAASAVAAVPLQAEAAALRAAAALLPVVAVVAPQPVAAQVAQAQHLAVASAPASSGPAGPLHRPRQAPARRSCDRSQRRPIRVSRQGWRSLLWPTAAVEFWSLRSLGPEETCINRFGALWFLYSTSA
jgi:hypothetical protein